jgi:hypothetical protein
MVQTRPKLTFLAQNTFSLSLASIEQRIISNRYANGKKLRGFSLPANYTDRATAAYRRS